MIEAKIIAHSICGGKEIITYELVYPRFIHSELMTHRLFSRNAASSRAIPVASVIEQVRTNPAMPIHWGENQPGMQAQKTLSRVLERSAKYLWVQAAEAAAFIAEQMVKLNLHKQVVNRILEPFQLMKTVVTATEWDNWFWLRNHTDAQPEIRMLAQRMLKAKLESVPIELQAGDWHVPYYGDGFWRDDSHSEKYAVHSWLVPDMQREDFDGVMLQDALTISASCCAQVSYRKLDDSLEKAKMVYARLVESTPVHASPFEHQATPMDYPYAVDTTELANMEGATHLDKDGAVWSGNFKGWIQHRQLVPNNVCWNYKDQE